MNNIKAMENADPRSADCAPNRSGRHRSARWIALPEWQTEGELMGFATIGRKKAR